MISRLLLLSCLLPLAAEARGLSDKNHLRTPDACFIVYASHNEAAVRCPIGARAMKVRDFWNGQLRGYSCRCNETVAPTTPVSKN